MSLFPVSAKDVWLGNVFLFGRTCLKSLSLTTWRSQFHDKRSEASWDVMLLRASLRS